MTNKISITELGENVKKIDYSNLNTIGDINTTNLFTQIIENTNKNSNNWFGIGVIIIIWSSIYFYLSNQRENIKLESLELHIFVLCLMLNISTILFIFGILQSLQFYIYIFICLVGLIIYKNGN